MLHSQSVCEKLDAILVAGIVGLSPVPIRVGVGASVQVVPLALVNVVSQADEDQSASKLWKGASY